MDDTKMFKTNADGRINSGEKLKIAIKAKYPLAPPCPTDEYRIAIKNISPKNRTSVIYVTFYGKQREYAQQLPEPALSPFQFSPNSVGNAGGRPVSGLSHRLLHHNLNFRRKSSETKFNFRKKLKALSN